MWVSVYDSDFYGSDLFPMCSSTISGIPSIMNFHSGNNFSFLNHRAKSDEGRVTDFQKPLTITHREVESVNFVFGRSTVHMSPGYMEKDDGWRQILELIFDLVNCLFRYAAIYPYLRPILWTLPEIQFPVPTRSFLHSMKNRLNLKNYRRWTHKFSFFTTCVVIPAIFHPTSAFNDRLLDAMEWNDFTYLNWLLKLLCPQAQKFFSCRKFLGHLTMTISFTLSSWNSPFSLPPCISV